MQQICKNKPCLDYFDFRQRTGTNLIWLGTQALAGFLGLHFAMVNALADGGVTAPAGEQEGAADFAIFPPEMLEKAKHPWRQAFELALYTAEPTGTEQQHVC